MIQLVIKGTVEDAKQAAKQRGITLGAACEQKQWSNVLAHCWTPDRQKIVDWFAEDEKRLDGGYEVGSLLYYSEMK